MCGPENKTDFNPSTDPFASGACENRYKPRAGIVKKATDIQYANGIPLLDSNPHAYV